MGRGEAVREGKYYLEDGMIANAGMIAYPPAARTVAEAYEKRIAEQAATIKALVDALDHILLSNDPIEHWDVTRAALAKYRD
jgi:hypothetical protein